MLNIAGGLTLTSTSNQTSELGVVQVITGNIEIKDATALTIDGLLNAAAGSVYLEGATGISF